MAWGRKGDQPRYRCVTHTEQAAWIGHPACRLVLLGPWAKLLRHLRQHSGGLLPGPLLRRPREAHRHCAPAGEGSEQTVSAFCKTGEW